METQSLLRYLLLVVVLLFSAQSLADTVWIDVRSALEHKIDSIDGDIRITHSDIVPEVEKLFPNKETEIKLYCRSGGRAGQAAQALQDAGYTNVESVGGIDDARKDRGLKE